MPEEVPQNGKWTPTAKAVDYFYLSSKDKGEAGKVVCPVGSFLSTPVFLI